MSRPLDYDVAIVGCGPVGVTLAGLLARRGLRAVAFDKDIELFPLPRAVHFDQEILRIVQELGCADEVFAHVLTNPGMDFLSADRQVLLSMRPEGPTPSGWPPSMLFHQPRLESILRASATALGAELQLGTEVVRVSDRGDHVELELGGGRTISAACAVGCDGARSMVRKQLGLAMDDLEFEEPWLVVDLILAAGVPMPSPLALQVCDPRRPCTLVPMPAPRFRFEFMLLPGEDPATINTAAQTRQFLSAWMDPDDAEVERSAVYTFHGLIATTWRAGRVVLAGDAAHQTPPFLGQGMCSGIRDAANLAWKLERIVGHGAPLELLDTYQAEREPQVRWIIGAAVGFGRVICTTDVHAAAERDTGMLAERAAGRGTIGALSMMDLGPGPLVGPGGGTAVIQPLVGGQRLDDAIGPRFAVLTRHQHQLDGPGPQWWQARGAALICADDEPAVIPVLDQCGAGAVVVRPDRFVLTSGPSVEVPGAELAALLGG
jgi:3-(3-hydroxy-phenyl)propionate hydroxylase